MLAPSAVNQATGSMRQRVVRIDPQRIMDGLVSLFYLLRPGIVPAVQAVAGDDLGEARPSFGRTRVEGNRTSQEAPRLQRVLRRDRSEEQAGRAQPQVERVRLRRFLGPAALRPNQLKVERRRDPAGNGVVQLPEFGELVLEPIAPQLLPG